jgi:endonuclease-3
MKKYVFKIISILSKRFKNIKCSLNFSNSFELLVATILSSRCTDNIVNKVTKKLFAKYRTVNDYANADIFEFMDCIKSTGFFKNKTKNIIKSSQLILTMYNGNVPETICELVKLPGIARKTANVILNNAFGKTSGIVVDTHVIRISKLLNITKYKDPVKIEQDLMKIIPIKYWIKFPLYIQSLGRLFCTAKKQKHEICPLNKICLYYCNKIMFK